MILRIVEKVDGVLEPFDIGWNGPKFLWTFPTEDVYIELVVLRLMGALCSRKLENEIQDI